MREVGIEPISTDQRPLGFWSAATTHSAGPPHPAQRRARRSRSEVFGTGVAAGCRAREWNEPEPDPTGAGDEIIACSGRSGGVRALLATGSPMAGRDHAGRADEVELGEQPGQCRSPARRCCRSRPATPRRAAIAPVCRSAPGSGGRRSRRSGRPAPARRSGSAPIRSSSPPEPPVSSFATRNFSKINPCGLGSLHLLSQVSGADLGHL
jgi:hypothetical protein